MGNMKNKFPIKVIILDRRVVVADGVAKTLNSLSTVDVEAVSSDLLELEKSIGNTWPDIVLIDLETVRHLRAGLKNIVLCIDAMQPNAKVVAVIDAYMSKDSVTCLDCINSIIVQSDSFLDLWNAVHVSHVNGRYISKVAGELLRSFT